MLEAIITSRKIGTEKFIDGINEMLSDYWAWAHSDIMGNAERGKINSITMVRSYDEALENARIFNNELGSSKNTINKLSLFRHWYYFEEIDTFAPSKFIGYKNINMKAYEIASSVSLDGRDTELALKKIFDNADESQRAKLKLKLFDFISQYDKIPNSLVEIHVKKSAY